MEKSKDNELDVFLKKIVREAGLEQPSADFTASVLSKVELATQKSAVSYKPIISKSTWWVLAVLVVAMFAYVIFGNPEVELPWLSALKFDIPTNSNFFNTLSNLRVSNTFTYGMVGLVFFLSIQVFLLKNRFDKRYAIE